MTVAQAGGVLLGLAAKVAPIAAVIVKLSLSQGQTQTGVSALGALAAVRVKLSLAQGHTQVGVIVWMADVAVIVSVLVMVGVVVGVMVTSQPPDSQEASKLETKIIGSKRKMLMSFLFIPVFPEKRD
jgi:hypothetical protein